MPICLIRLWGGEFIYSGYQQTAGIRIGADGKPEVDGICFNLSHSGNIVICGTAEKEVGCDVEKIVEAPEGVAERFFHPNETAYINKH